jgi:hypothetical protein
MPTTDGSIYSVGIKFGIQMIYIEQIAWLKNSEHQSETGRRDQDEKKFGKPAIPEQIYTCKHGTISGTDREG